MLTDHQMVILMREMVAGKPLSAAAAGVTERVIKNQTGHRSEKLVRRDIREGPLFRENAAAAVGM